MKTGRGSPWLGWAALLVGVAVGGVRAAEVAKTLDFVAGNSGVQVHSSPAIGPDGTIYIGVGHPTQPKGALLAIDPRTQAMKAGWPAPGFVPGNSVDSSPALSRDGAVVYCSSVDGFLYAVSAANGRELWSKRVGVFSYSSPAVGGDGSVYVGSGSLIIDGVSGDNGLHAFTPDGASIWDFKTEQSVYSSPAIAPDGTLYFGTIDGHIYAVNSTGTQKWVQTAPVAAIVSAPAIGTDGTVYVGSYDGYMYALAPENGAVKWQFPIDDSGYIEASPVIGPDGAIYFGASNGRFYALKPDGTRKWEPVGVPTPIVSSAVIRSDGVIIFGAHDGVIRAIDADNAKSVWTYNTRRGQITQGEEIESSPVVSPVDGTVYVGSMSGRVYGFAGTGTGPLVSGYAPWPMHRRDVQHTARTPAVANGGRLSNLATRAQAGNGTTLIAGLVTAGAGTGTKPYMIRAIGPTLSTFDLASPLRDPTLAIHRQGFEDVLFANDDWGSDGNATQIVDTANKVGAFALPAGSKDAVVLPSLEAGLYTASVESPAGDTGIALIEVYDADVTAPGARLVNLSTRAQVGTGDRMLIPGLVITGPDPIRLLIRAVGPGLAAFGVSGFLERPSMTVFSGAQPLRTNTGWSTSPDKGDIAGAMAVVNAFSLAEGSADCAAVMTLGAGNYTIQVSGVGGTTGEAIVEVYVLP